MNIDVLVILVSFSSLIIGIFIGVQFFKYYTKKQDKKILENAEEVLSGKRDNKIKIDGEQFDAKRFRLRGEDDKERLFDLKGGEIQDGKKNSQEGIESEEIQNSSSLGENNSSIRNLQRDSTEKKRTSRNGSRSRRFG